ncbi:hypothetical protein L195_g061477, partial [Trifolium pratense]
EENLTHKRRPNSHLQYHPLVFIAPSRVVTLLHYYVRVTPSPVTCSRRGGCRHTTAVVSNIPLWFETCFIIMGAFDS